MRGGRFLCFIAASCVTSRVIDAQPVPVDIHLSVAKLRGVPITPQAVATALADATKLLQEANCGGRGCPVQLHLTPNAVADYGFLRANATLTHYADRVALKALPVNGFMVSRLTGNSCGHGPGFVVGCAIINSGQFAMAIQAAPEPVHWAHEIGHSLGLLHRQHARNQAAGRCAFRDECAIMNCAPIPAIDRDLGQGFRLVPDTGGFTPADECDEFLRQARAQLHTRVVDAHRKRIFVVAQSNNPVAVKVRQIGDTTGLWATTIEGDLRTFNPAAGVYEAIVFVSAADADALTDDQEKMLMMFIRQRGRSVILIGNSLRSARMAAISGAKGVVFSAGSGTPQLRQAGGSAAPAWTRRVNRHDIPEAIPVINDLSANRLRHLSVGTNSPGQTTDIVWSRTLERGRVLCLALGQSPATWDREDLLPLFAGSFSWALRYLEDVREFVEFFRH